MRDYRGFFNRMLDDLSSNPLLPVLFHESNKRKSYQEKILRFFALRNFSEYKSSILKAMNSYMQQHQHDDDTEKNKTLFNRTIDIIKQILGDTAFLGLNRVGSRDRDKFSGTVYDSIIVPFSFYDNHDLMAHADKIREAIEDLKQNNKQYYEDTYISTGSRQRVVGRIMAVYKILQDITGYSGDQRIFSEEVKKKLFHNGYICPYCNNVILSIDDAEVDHIVPFSKGGKTDITNAQLLHKHYNRAKGGSIYVN